MTILQDQLVRLSELADSGDAQAVYAEASQTLTELQGGLSETEAALADALHALAGCVRNIEGRGEDPPCLREARAILEEARGPAA